MLSSMPCIVAKAFSAPRPNHSTSMIASATAVRGDMAVGILLGRHLLPVSLSAGISYRLVYSVVVEKVRASEKVGETRLSAVAVGLIAFGLILASIAIGLMMRYWVPESHISGDSKEVIRLATALIGTMAAVVLALLFASTRTSFEATNSSVGRMTTSVIELDHMLREYGPEGEALRKALRQDVVAIVASIWHDDAAVQHPAHPSPPEGQGTVLTKMRQLPPASHFH